MSETIFGTIRLKFDKQNRVVLPVWIFKALGEKTDFVFVPHPVFPYIEGRTKSSFNKLHKCFLNDNTISSDIKETYENFYFGAAEYVDIDQNGKITFPKTLLLKKKMTEFGIFVFCGNKIIIWPEDKYEEEKIKCETTLKTNHDKLVMQQFYSYNLEEEGVKTP